MTLELNKLLTDIQQAGAEIAKQADLRAKLLPEALKQLARASTQDDLRAKAKTAIKLNWSGAIPTDEPIDRTFPASDLPRPTTIIATDGSQIYPNPHSAMLYYVLNIGGIVLRLGTGEAPEVIRRPILAYQPDDLTVGGYTVSTGIVNLRRTTAEMTTLADLVAGEHAHRSSGDMPVVALMDGPIAMRSRTEPIPGPELERLQNAYLAAMDDLAMQQAALAGYVDRPGGSTVLSLVMLSSVSLEEVPAYMAQELGPPFSGLPDRALFGQLLEPGDRSAIFEIASGWNRDYSAHNVPGMPGQSQSIHFFYLNVGAENAPQVVRVECPEWVATQPRLVNWLHAALVAQCNLTVGPSYPYVLARADEEAVIQNPEKNRIEDMLMVEMLKHQITPEMSAKQTHKTWARSSGRVSRRGRR